jgi:hypothetical protein
MEKCAGMLRLLSQNLPVNLLSLLQMPGLMALQSQIEVLLDRGFIHAATGQYQARVVPSQDSV